MESISGFRVITKWLKIIVAVAAVVALAVVVVVSWALHRQEVTSRRSTVLILKVLAHQSEQFALTYGRWPSDLSELSSAYGPVQHDSWGGAIIYQPFSTETGFGVVRSLGKDALVGGKGPNEDTQVRFGHRYAPADLRRVE